MDLNRRWHRLSIEEKHNLPTESLLKLYIIRPLNPVIYNYITKYRPDVLSGYEVLKKLANWA